MNSSETGKTIAIQTNGLCFSGGTSTEIDGQKVEDVTSVVIELIAGSAATITIQKLKRSPSGGFKVETDSEGNKNIATETFMFRGSISMDATTLDNSLTT